MPIGNTYQAMPVKRDTIQTISNSNIATIIKDMPETIKMTAKTKSAKAGRLPWAHPGRTRCQHLCHHHQGQPSTPCQSYQELLPR